MKSVNWEGSFLFYCRNLVCFSLIIWLYILALSVLYRICYFPYLFHLSGMIIVYKLKLLSHSPCSFLDCVALVIISLQCGNRLLHPHNSGLSIKNKNLSIIGVVAKVLALTQSWTTPVHLLSSKLKVGFPPCWQTEHSVDWKLPEHFDRFRFLVCWRQNVRAKTTLPAGCTSCF